MRKKKAAIQSDKQSETQPAIWLGQLQEGMNKEGIS